MELSFYNLNYDSFCFSENLVGLKGMEPEQAVSELPKILRSLLPEALSNFFQGVAKALEKENQRDCVVTSGRDVAILMQLKYGDDVVADLNFYPFEFRFELEE